METKKDAFNKMSTVLLEEFNNTIIHLLDPVPRDSIVVEDSAIILEKMRERVNESKNMILESFNSLYLFSIEDAYSQYNCQYY